MFSFINCLGRGIFITAIEKQLRQSTFYYDDRKNKLQHVVEGFHSVPWMALIPFVAQYQNLLLLDSPNVFLESHPTGMVLSFPLLFPWPLIFKPFLLPYPVCSFLVAFSAALLIIGAPNTPQIWHLSWHFSITPHLIFSHLFPATCKTQIYWFYVNSYCSMLYHIIAYVQEVEDDRVWGKLSTLCILEYETKHPTYCCFHMKKVQKCWKDE